jgi:hypothetical protein
MSSPEINTPFIQIAHSNVIMLSFASLVLGLKS